LSSAIATRIRTFPHAAVELVLKLMLGKPATFRKSVVTAPDPLPDTPGSDGSEDRVDQQAANGEQ